MTQQKKQWLLCGVIAGLAALSYWGLVRWAGLMSPAPPTPTGPSIVGGESANPAPSVPPPLQPAQLPFSSNQVSGEAAAPGAGGAVVPMFEPQSSLANTADYYLKQICGDRTPTLEDWQKLVDMKVQGAESWFHAPMGPGHYATSACVDRQNYLWVGTEGEGVYRFSPSDGMWQHFNTVSGLGDDCVYALACDLQGRVWASSLNHGVAVWNGIRWQVYETVGGLSRSGTLSGPLDQHVFHISVCPETATGSLRDNLTEKESLIAGSVWLCTANGFSIYFPSTDSWSYLTRADGLPSDQASSLAFANDGTVFVATQCDGIAIASPNDHYESWKQIARRTDGSANGPLSDDLPITPTGAGLPSNFLNDILVAKDGTIYAATTAGLAWSLDNGTSWRFVRGADYGARVKGQARGAPPGWAEESGAILAEDYCTCLCEDERGMIHVGHRVKGSDHLSPQAAGLVAPTSGDFATAIVPYGPYLVSANYGSGLMTTSRAMTSLTEPHVAGRVPMPAGATALNEKALQSTISKLSSSRSNEPIFLGDDWSTQGNWVGRYGRSLAVLCAMGSPQDHVMTRRYNQYSYTVGLLAGEADQVRSWIQELVAKDNRSLYDPELGIRRTAGLDDHGESYVRSHEGPGLGLVISIPAGLHRISAYFLNDNGHATNERCRDYALAFQTKENDNWHERARTRVSNFWGGVYKQLVIQGPSQVRLAIAKGNSHNVMCAGLFVDWAGPGTVPQEREPYLWMANVRLGPDPASTANANVQSFMAMYDNLVRTSQSDSLTTALSRSLYVHLYRAVLAQPATPPAVVSQWKWELRLWSDADRSDFEKQMAVAWRQMQERVPALKNAAVRPNSPGATRAAPNSVPK